MFVALGITLDVTEVVTSADALGGHRARRRAGLRRATARDRAAAGPHAPAARRAALPDVGRPQGGGADPPGRARRALERRRGAPHLRADLRGGRVLGARPGLDRSLGRPAARACACARASPSRGGSRSTCRRSPATCTAVRVRAGSYAAGRTIKELPLGEYGWIVTIVRDGEVMRPGGSSVLQPGDEVVVSSQLDDVRGVRRLFDSPGAPPS